MVLRLTMLSGGLALLLATAGLYGVTAYTLARLDGLIPVRRGPATDPAQGLRME